MTEPDPSEDLFDTAGLRAGVLASWADSPTRFREDANAEEDLLLGGYGVGPARSAGAALVTHAPLRSATARSAGAALVTHAPLRSATARSAGAALADRWLVELAQNAADAARRAGTPGKLLVQVVSGAAETSEHRELRVANTGVPLDAEGVAALASLRASTKRDDDAVGRFGVGFAAVLGVSAEPRIVSTSGGVRFSAERTRAEVAALPGAAPVEL
ncbi:MAG: hypothetical protein M3Z25_22505, partial [Actinomycetota bacterium]|nr:hypothetical protein [Actinomycetota bacterium]